jgi:hypothetical protein
MVCGVTPSLDLFPVPRLPLSRLRLLHPIVALPFHLYSMVLESVETEVPVAGTQKPTHRHREDEGSWCYEPTTWMQSRSKPRVIIALFVSLIRHQPAVLFSQNKSATSNQPTVLFSQNKLAPAISHQ